MWKNVNNTIYQIACWFEVVGFFISLITAIKVFVLNKEIKWINNHHIFQATISEHLERLKEISTNVSQKNQIIQLELLLSISNCNSHLKSIRKTIKKNEIEEVISCSKYCQKLLKRRFKFRKNKFPYYELNRTTITETHVDEFYLQLNSVINCIINYNIEYQNKLK